MAQHWEGSAVTHKGRQGREKVRTKRGATLNLSPEPESRTRSYEEYRQNKSGYLPSMAAHITVPYKTSARV